MRKPSLARQFLVWQLAVVALLLVAVAGVATMQQDAGFRATEGRRMLSVAEDVAANLEVRRGLAVGYYDSLPAIALSARDISGADEIVIVDAHGVIRAAEDPAQIGTRFDPGGSSAALGRAWVGNPDGRTVVAQVPVSDRPLQVIGVVAARVRAPSLLAGMLATPWPTLTLLGIALVLGVGGSLLLARRVRRQTLGLEPAEIVELVQRREAMLLGVKEGVVGMDAAARVTLVNEAAGALLGITHTGGAVADLDLDDRTRAVLLGEQDGADQMVLHNGMVLVLNRMPVEVNGERVGAVVTLRDRTELVSLEGRLDAARHVTDTLRAQTHEFANRLHTIAGLTELGEYDQVRQFVAGIVAGTDQWRREVTTAVGDPAAAALLVAKASLATERGVALRLEPGARLVPSAVPDAALSADLVTVLGNLVDNALDAVGPAGERWVQVGVRGDPGSPDPTGVTPDPAGPDSDGAVTVTVTDSGPGVPAALAERVFQQGFTTKQDDPGHGRGLGLALVRQVCLRRGGQVAVDGATFTAVLPGLRP